MWLYPKWDLEKSTNELLDSKRTDLNGRFCSGPSKPRKGAAFGPPPGSKEFFKCCRGTFKTQGCPLRAQKILINSFWIKPHSQKALCGIRGTSLELQRIPVHPTGSKRISPELTGRTFWSPANHFGTQNGPGGILQMLSGDF